MSKLERNIALVYALTITLLLGLGGWLIHNATQTAATFREIDRATRVLRAAETVLLDMLNIQTATRGFLLTGEDAFLQPYRLGVRDIPRALRELEAACADRPSHAARVRLIVEREAQLAELIEERLAARRAENYVPEQMLQNLRTGKAHMDAIRRAIDAIEDEEREVLQRHSAAAQAGVTQVVHLVTLLGASVLAIVTIAAWRVLRATRSRGQAEQALRDLNRDLERRVATRTRELELSTAHLQSLSRRLLDIQERERRALAQELHDEIGQAITAVKLALQSLQRTPPTGTPAAERLQGAVALAASTLEQIRSLSLNLRPPMLDDLGLVAALRWLISRVGDTPQAPRIRFTEALLEQRASSSVEIAAFRIVQEALTNVLRHARATEAGVELTRADRALEVVIEDNGAGFDVAAERARALEQGTSLGLAGMEERAVFAGGSLVIEARSGGGTRVTARFPDAFGP